MTQYILQAIFDGYTLPHHGIHGPHHWARVLENGTIPLPALRAHIERWIATRGDQ